VLRFLDVRFERAFRGYDALRVDHPHGLVCPWVYRADAPDPHQAVGQGARLLSSPDLEDHPALSAWSIPSPEQIDRDQDRWADDRVRELSGEQVLRYGALLERALLAAKASTDSRRRLVCEVLSTMPHPLQRVMAREGMGRFRVTHKASLTDPLDVYRAENACAEDWVMLATQDTPPIWQVIARWRETGEVRERAAHLARSLSPAGDPAPRLQRELEQDDAALATGMLAELLACPARHVLVFFTDLLGIGEPYNRPGVDDPRNWTLRAPPLGQPGAPLLPLDVPRACALALRARGIDSPALLEALEGPA
jgi:4-alpha-glucanotransferase